MAKKISVTAGPVVLLGSLNDGRVAREIAAKLPITAKARTWGDEIYFPIPVRTKIDVPVTKVEKGDLGYWPEGACFCIFFGPTPMSRGDEIVPASAVEVVGRVEGDLSALKGVKDGDTVVIAAGNESND